MTSLTELLQRIKIIKINLSSQDPNSVLQNERKLNTVKNQAEIENNAVTECGITFNLLTLLSNAKSRSEGNPLLYYHMQHLNPSAYLQI